MLITNYFKPVYANKIFQTNFSSVNLPVFSGKPEDYQKKIFLYQRNLSTLGIKSYLFDNCDIKNLILAKSVHDAFFDIKNAGFNIPKGISVHCNDAADHFERGSNDMAYTYTESERKQVKPEIYLNTPHYKYNKNLPYVVHSSGGDPKIYNAKMDIYHEFAHAYQAINNKKNYLSLGDQKFDRKTKNEITKCLNSYAATNKSEFVAEYFAYKMAGIKIKSNRIDLEKIYNECHGPKFKKKLDLVA
ncbi:MAG TPA: hypothetical protein DDW90_00680 [Cyanobacteria bacterium UBA9971]|nr:hypothetical protein [Cyanobacteria bacterium UBA9971]